MVQLNRVWARGLVAAGLLALSVSAVMYLRPLEVASLIVRARLRMQGEHSHDVTLESHKIHYREMGTGKPLLLVHGLGGSSLDWAPVMAIYARAGYHVYAPDLLGFGKSDAPDSGYSIADQTQLLQDFVSSQNIQQADIMGWSMGGWIALKFTVDHPSAVRRLVLYDSAGLLFRPGFAPSVFTPATVGEVKTLFSLLEPKGHALPGFIARDVVRGMRGKHGWVITRSVESMMTRADLLDGKLGAIKQPVLIAWGADDELIPLSSAYALEKQIPQADLEVFQNCGHLAPARCAVPVSNHTLQFLQAAVPPAGVTQEIAGPVPY